MRDEDRLRRGRDWEKMGRGEEREKIEEEKRDRRRV
jgi:hypothetical protein